MPELFSVLFGKKCFSFYSDENTIIDDFIRDISSNNFSITLARRYTIHNPRQISVVIRVDPVF